MRTLRKQVKRPRGAVNRQAIVLRALDIADREGLDAASIRRLAAEFGVTPMALYHHFHDRADLWTAMADRFWAEVSVPEESGDWSHDLRWLLLSFIAARRRHPCASELLQKRAFSPEVLRISEAALDTLGRAGFKPGEAVRIIQQLAALFAEPGQKSLPIDESLESYPRLRDTIHSNLWHDSAHHLELGVDIVMLGIHALLEQTRRERESA